ncbi:MAG: NOB1 family endonuclease [Conexivisphaera sp.]
MPAVRYLVLDTSAFEAGLPNVGDYRLVITPGVLRELERRGRLDPVGHLIEAGLVEVREPAARDLEAAARAAEAAGDSARLSGTDLEVLAVALGLSAAGNSVTVMTDDISIQNVSARLGIEAVGALVGRRRAIRWIYYCPACGTPFPVPPPGLRCPACGTPLRRKPRGRSGPRGARKRS